MNYTFDEIYGNERIKKTLRRSVLENTISHAYIFEGAAGSGKTLLALSFAKFIFCETKTDNCTCHSCIQFIAESHSDLIIIKRPEKVKSLGVELIRTSLVNEVNKKPFEYDRKIFIIEEADLMTAEAQNALLRSIEEPPEYAVFLLLAGKSKRLLPTVLSRCFTYKMKSFGISAVSEKLSQLGMTSEKADAASAYSGGSIGQAIVLAESDAFFEMRERINKALGQPRKLETLFTDLAGLEDFKENADLLAAIAIIWHRDILAYKAAGGEAFIFQRDNITQIAACAELFSFKELYRSVNSIIEFRKNIASNAAFSAAIDALAINLSNSGEDI